MWHGVIEMDAYEPLIQSIAARLKAEFRPATADGIQQLRDLRFPEPIIKFYERYEPRDCVEGVARLWQIADIMVENRDGVPGICVVPHGYRVFASTYSGDAYCFNLNRLSPAGDPAIVLISTGDVGEDSPAEEVHNAANPVARDLLQFLRWFEQEEPPEFPL